ncbi:heterokaryon incompatibility protein [Fusarium bulbicola]|nr:heterokaryon incompatibility protein [Fusarium bulbicola]
MTKAATVLMTLLGTAFAQIDKTCIDIAFNSETNTLSGKCQPRDNSGYIPSELDLNDCFGYDGTTITSDKVAVPIETRNMSFDHSRDQITKYLSFALEFPQQPRPLTLDLLPTEILLQISGEPGKDRTTLSAREFKGLCLLSPSLSKLCLPFHYFSNNHGAFRDAIRDADVKVLDLCVQLGAAPPALDMGHMKWQLPESGGCKCLSELPHTHQRPIDELLESVYLGRAPIGKCVDTLKWLMDKGCDMTEQGDQNWYKGNEHCDHVLEFLVTILSKSPDRTRTEGICQMINLLQIRGYSLPFTMNMHTYWMSKSWMTTPDRSSPGLIMKPLELALRSHCPLYFLELVLRDYMRRLVKFKVSHVRPPPLMDRWAGDYAYVDQGADHVYRGEAADIFEQKRRIIIEYRVVDEDERKILKKIVKAMRSLTPPINASTSAVTHDREAQRCWETLYSILIPFTSIYGMSGATCSLGKVGPHDVVLVGKAKDMTNVSVFVKATVDDLLEGFSSIRAGFLIGVDGTAPEDSPAKPGDIVVAFPQGLHPGQVHRLLSDRDLANRIGCDSEIMCFERAGASIKSRFPILTVCGILGSTSHCSSKLNGSALRRIKMATVIYTMFIFHRISTTQLQDEHAFTDRFQYEPFDLETAGFRLVRLEKGVQSQLRCHLWQAYLNDNDIIPYEALSYSWGSQNTPREIMVDGKILSITESLYEALWYLRRPDEDRMLWVDALSIDQNNIKERGHQVNRMGEIYEKADRVIIWLGYVGGNAVKLKSGIDMLEKKLPSHALSQWSREDIRWKQTWKEVETGLGVFCQEELMDGLRAFMEKPWFSRVWVLQEVANAKRATVKCNLGEMSTKIFALLPYLTDVEVSQQCQYVLDIMPGEMRQSSWWNKSRNLCHLLWKFRGCQATDPRDRVYALLGMATDIQESGIRADYAKEEQVVLQELYAYILDKTESPFQITLEVGLKCLQRFPDVFEILLQRPEFVIQPMPDFVVQAMEYQPHMLGRLIASSTDPEQLKNGVILKATERGLPACRAFFDNCESPIKISQKMVKKSMFCHQDVLQYLLEKAQYPIDIFENFSLEATLQGLHILDEYGNLIAITKELISEGIVAGSDLLQLYLVAMETPIELEEDLFIKAIGNGLGTLECMLRSCTKPFNITKRVYRQAIQAGIEVLSCLFQESPFKFKITESRVTSAIEILNGNVERPLIKTSLVESLLNHGSFVGRLRIIGPVRRRLDTEEKRHQFVAKNIFRGIGKEKLQVTDKIRLIAKTGKAREMIKTQKAEKDVSEDVAIKAIEDGPEAFAALFNKRDTNFRVTERIREVASGHIYAFETLRAKRQSEVFPNCDLNFVW